MATTEPLTVTRRPAPIALKATVNGREVESHIEPRRTLLDWLRNDLGLTGAKRSCDLQVCGACTVLIDGVPVSSCCTLAYEANGKEVTTIEGLALHGKLDPVQEAFIAESAIQCGFCTPGMILSVKALLAESPNPKRDEIANYLSGNLCRCTGYWNIIDAVERAAARIAGSLEGDAK